MGQPQRHRGHRAEHGEQMKEPDSSEDDPLTREIISAAIEVHRFFGPGLLINFKVQRLVDGINRVSL